MVSVRNSVVYIYVVQWEYVSVTVHIYTTAKLPYTYRVLCVLYRYTSTGDLKLPFRNKTHSSDTSTPDRYPCTHKCRELQGIKVLFGSI